MPATGLSLTDTSTKISFTATGCVGTSNFVLSGDTSGNSATLSYTFSQPAVTVSPAEVTLSGFTGVTLSAYTSILATPSGLSVTLGSQTLNVVAVLSSAVDDCALVCSLCSSMLTVLQYAHCALVCSLCSSLLTML